MINSEQAENVSSNLASSIKNLNMSVIVNTYMGNPEAIIRRYVIEHYGDLITPGESIFDNSSKLWKIKLRSVYPHLTKNNVEFFQLEDLGTIEMNERYEVVNAPSNEDCVKQISLKLDLLTKI